MNELPTAKPENPKAQTKPSASDNLAGVKNVIAIASGKGGVGKSTVSVNLALSLARAGHRVGLMDGDVYGPSVAKMLGGIEPPQDQQGKLKPILRHGVYFMSMAVLTDEDTPVIWRGPMASKLIQTFLNQVAWGELDYLLIDLPPGTGDIQLTLTQAAPLTGAIIVTSPQEVAVGVTMRGIKMFEQVNVPIIGLIENMSGFVCGHCSEETPIFRKGFGERTAREKGLHFLGRIPLDPNISLHSDLGEDISQSQIASPAVTAIADISQAILTRMDQLKDETPQHALPEKVEMRDGQLWILWPDDQEVLYDSFELRYQCSCAQCVDENSGKRKIQRADIPEDIALTGFKAVGHYGLQLSWSDWHSTGIYTYERLKAL